jgi:hypothetical protein
LEKLATATQCFRHLVSGTRPHREIAVRQGPGIAKDPAQTSGCKSVLKKPAN